MDYNLNTREATPLTHPYHPQAMTKLQEHQSAMRSGGYSPFFGWILDGKTVSQDTYWSERARAERTAKRMGQLWS